jgi:hypothetical protein
MLLSLLSFFDLYVVAAAPPVSKFTPRADPPTTSSQDGTSICGRRLMFGIVWGCLSTIFLCAWVSVHPNIPKPQRLEGIYRRFQLLFWMLVAPELILVLAMRQWVAAGRVAGIYNDAKLKTSKSKRLSPQSNLFQPLIPPCFFSSSNMDKGARPIHYNGWLDDHQPPIRGERCRPKRTRLFKFHWRSHVVRAIPALCERPIFRFPNHDRR